MCCNLFQSFYFSRDDVAFPGFAKYFKKNSDEEREHAQKFMEYQVDYNYFYSIVHVQILLHSAF